MNIYMPQIANIHEKNQSLLSNLHIIHLPGLDPQ